VLGVYVGEGILERFLLAAKLSDALGDQLGLDPFLGRPNRAIELRALADGGIGPAGWPASIGGWFRSLFGPAAPISTE